MELIRGLHNLQDRHRSGVVTIGNFDGLHLGHQAIVEQLVERAKKRQLPSTVMIFEPQPLEFFQGERSPMRLMAFRDKVTALSRSKVDRLFCLKFDQCFSTFSAERFIQQVLVDGLAVQHLLVGDDFRFGKGREGCFDLLFREGARLGFSVERANTFELEGARVSSTRIRTLLASGEVEAANHLLGRPYTLSGRVESGLKLGRQLSAPTANIALSAQSACLAGVYVVRVRVGQERYQGVANIGMRPTVISEADQAPRLEAHLFDFNGDLYRQRLEVELLHKLRNEQKFASLELLKAAILNDIQQAKAWFT